MGDLYLSVYDSNYRLLDQIRIVERSKTYVGIQDATVYNDKLYISWDEIERFENYYRRGVGVYGFATKQFDALCRGQGAQPGANSWEGGLEAWWGDLWAVHLDQFPGGTG